MAATKRKVANPSKNKSTSVVKKAKVERNAAKKPKTPLELRETETDSDPIEESNTTEHSGEDDGISWPSEEERRDEQDAPEDDDDEDGRVSLPQDEKISQNGQLGNDAKQRKKSQKSLHMY